MGELKSLREQQESLVNRAKELNRKLYLAGMGAISKAESTSNELLDKYVASGKAAYGEDAESKSKVILAGRGLLQNTRELIESAPEKRQELYEKFIEAGRSERGEQADATNEFVLAGLGAIATARQESTKLFDELVAAGEKRA